MHHTVLLWSLICLRIWGQLIKYILAVIIFSQKATAKTVLSPKTLELVWGQQLLDSDDSIITFFGTGRTCNCHPILYMGQDYLISKNLNSLLSLHLLDLYISIPEAFLPIIIATSLQHVCFNPQDQQSMDRRRQGRLREFETQQRSSCPTAFRLRSSRQIPRCIFELP